MRILLLLVPMFMFLSSCGGSGGGSKDPLPPVPSGVTAVVTGPSQISLGWNASAGASSYRVYWKLSTDSIYVVLSSSTTQFIHRGLIQGNTYQYAVSALNDAGESAATSLISVPLATAVPPSLVSAVAGTGQVTVTWSTVPGASTYNLYWSTSTPVTTASSSLRSVTSPFVLASLIDGTTYYLTLSAENIIGEGGLSTELAVTPGPASGPVITVSGHIAYEDKEYTGSGAGVIGSGGFTGNTNYKAVRYAEIEVVNASNGSVLSSGVTDSGGRYSLGVNSLTPAPEVYVRIISSATFSAPAVEVKDLSRNALYVVAGAPFPASGDAAAAIRIPAGNDAAGAFNILDVLVTGSAFVKGLTGSYPPLLNAYWEVGNTAVGTYYCPISFAAGCLRGSGIYILGGHQDGSGDSDQYDDDVIWHEYGHFAGDRYSRDESPGGFHSLFEHDQDMRLSWSEGWGNFFPLAVKQWLWATDPALLSAPTASSSLYVDTADPGWSFDFNRYDARTVYSTSESAIAKVLYNLMLPGTGGFDMQTVWNIFEASLPAAAGPANFEAFWDGWLAAHGSPGDIAAGTAILAERQIFYIDDGFEPGDNGFSRTTPITLGIPETHYLYSTALGSDIDIVPLAASSGSIYTVQTTSIKNGGDTFLRVFGPDQSSVITANDNSGVLSSEINNCDTAGRCALSSRLTFQSTQSGTYYIEVTTSAARPAYAGKYGTYDLLITSP